LEITTTETYKFSEETTNEGITTDSSSSHVPVTFRTEMCHHVNNDSFVVGDDTFAVCLELSSMLQGIEETIIHAYEDSKNFPPSLVGDMERFQVTLFEMQDLPADMYEAIDVQEYVMRCERIAMVRSSK